MLENKRESKDSGRSAVAPVTVPAGQNNNTGTTADAHKFTRTTIITVRALAWPYYRARTVVRALA